MKIYLNSQQQLAFRAVKECVSHLSESKLALQVRPP